MAVTRERFEQGMTYEAYKAQMTRNRERLEENERTVELVPEDVRFFAQLPRLHVLVLAEDWCGDVVNNLPVLARLAEASGTLDLRIFLRDQNLDLMDQYLNQGVHRSIPTFVFFDEDFRELGHWIERPAAITELQRQGLDELYATDPAMAGVARGTSPALMPEAARVRQAQFYSEFRARNRALADREVVREIRELLASRLPAGA
ncbi:MAG TPA: thioredoxin family protein [Roseiflexaceae bacterium]|nr:thioredoxin family protein [Roseiflexaceae bacterium]